MKDTARGTQVGSNLELGDNAIGFGRDKANAQEAGKQWIEDRLKCRKVVGTAWWLLC